MKSWDLVGPIETSIRRLDETLPMARAWGEDTSALMELRAALEHARKLAVREKRERGSHKVSHEKSTTHEEE